MVSVQQKSSGGSFLGRKVQLLSLLLQRQPSSVLVADADGDTALHHVAQATELEARRVGRPRRILMMEL